jgi:alkanesulfonate monooxygenase SsuD/methylene tetrahydromethanopterin reductase-like flavin-dependent oxidoreductase (luciferase family)
MEFGICVASRPADLDYVVQAESLGYTHAWMADSQMIWSDVYAMLALLTERTTRMHLGTGVAVAPTRPAPVTAAAMATINQLAPGRTFCGIGTGNTAMRTMGHKPMKIAEFDQYLATLVPLLRGEEAPFTWRGDTAHVTHLMPDMGFVAFEPVIPVYVSAFGPRALGLACQHGDGLITSVPPVPAAVAGLRQKLGEIDPVAGEPSEFPVATLTTMCVLDEGESAGSARCKEQTGAFAIASLHYAYEQFVNFGRPPSHTLEPFWDDYVAMLEMTPIERRHQRIHLGHNCWVIPEEEQFVTQELIERTCMVGTAAELRERVVALEAAGLNQLVLLPPLDCKEQVIARVSAEVMP